MSRAFHPPDTLSRDDIRTIADVRRDIWTQGWKGMAGGAVAAGLGHAAVTLGNKRQLWKVPTNPNTRMASVFLGGSLGALVMATTAGKNAVHELHPIFEVGNRNNNSDTPEKSEASIEEDLLKARQQNRVYRRDSLMKSMESGHGGLSDAHGGTWSQQTK